MQKLSFYRILTVKIYDDSDFGIHNLPREGNQDMNNVNFNQTINESSSYSQTEIPIKLPKSNDHIKYCNPDHDTWQKALVIGLAGKATGQNNYWFNIKNLDIGDFYSIEFNKWKYLQEEILINSSSDSENIKILDAKMKEISNQKDHKVFEEVADEGQNTVSVRWVITKKNKDDEPVYKARLVVRGFEETEKDEIRKDSPMCFKKNFRLILSSVITKYWKINSLDIKSAFLKGHSISDDILVKPPKEVNTTNIWKLLVTRG